MASTIVYTDPTDQTGNVAYDATVVVVYETDEAMLQAYTNLDFNDVPVVAGGFFSAGYNGTTALDDDGTLYSLPPPSPGNKYVAVTVSTHPDFEYSEKITISGTFGPIA